MNILLCSVFVLFYATSVFPERRIIRTQNPKSVENGTSVLEQVLLVRTLNEDRQMIGKKLNIKFEIVEYDYTLELQLLGMQCNGDRWIARTFLQMNNVTRKIIEHHSNVLKSLQNRTSQSMFHPNQTKIGCTKTLRCFDTVHENHGFPAELIGKVGEAVGGCLMGPHVDGMSPDLVKKFADVGMPDSTKYGDLLGVEKPWDGKRTTTTTRKPLTEEEDEDYEEDSSRRIGFSITVFLVVFVYYF